MIFFSRSAQYRLVLKPSTVQHIRIQGSDEHREVKNWGISAQFEPLTADGYSVKGRRWRGKLDTEVWVKKVQSIHPDVTEADLTSKLVSDPRYGTDFIAFTEDGREAMPDDAMIEDNGDGTFICRACDDQLIKSAQGLPGHFGSKKHGESRARFINSLRDRLKIRDTSLPPV